ncbi:MAG TPA: rhodanese-like domain-containing protein [Acidimicrobiales bacterium]|nr:rhodanese-like domain-containing protein [Acidimicrobiales bacterium]
MFESIGRERVRELMDEGAQVVEVLEEDQYRLAHLPGALHLFARQFSRERVEELLDRDRPVVLYCLDNL